MSFVNSPKKSFAGHSEVLRTMKSFSDKSPGTTPARAHDLSKTSATKLRALLEKRQGSMKNIQHDQSLLSESDSQDTLSMEDVATLLNDSYNLTKHLEEQVQFYQDTVNVLRQRSEQVVVENEMLYEKLKGNLVTDVLQRERNASLNKAEIRGEGKGKEKETEKLQSRQPKQQITKEVQTTLSTDETLTAEYRFHDRQYIRQLDHEMDKIKKLNQDKTHRLESILQATREELEEYRCQASKLQSQLRTFETEREQRQSNMCSRCGRKEGIFSAQPTDAYKKTMEKLTRERDELMETLAKQKCLLTNSQQREFEAYIEVKRSVETVEKAQLEKAEAIIKIQQLRNSMLEERNRHETLLASNNEKTKREYADIKEHYEEKMNDLKSKLQEQTQKCDTTENQLDKLSREKVNLIVELEKTKAELATCQAEILKITQDGREEVANITRQRLKTQQEVDNLHTLQARRLREHEQEKVSLVSENEELRQRLCEAQSGWVESREECIRSLDQLKKFETDLHLATASKANLEKSRQDNLEFWKKQEEQREKQFLETLEEKEKEHVALRREIEQMLESQMQMSKMLKDESNKLTQKLEEKTEKHRLDKKEWREQHSQLTTKLQTLLKQHEAVTNKNQKDSKINKNLSAKVDFLKEENRKKIETIYELLKKQNGLMRDRQTLSHEIEHFRSQVAITCRVPEREISVDDELQSEDDDTLSNSKPINGQENVADASL